MNCACFRCNLEWLRKLIRLQWEGATEEGCIQQCSSRRYNWHNRLMLGSLYKISWMSGGVCKPVLQLIWYVSMNVTSKQTPQIQFQRTHRFDICYSVYNWSVVKLTEETIASKNKNMIICYKYSMQNTHYFNSLSVTVTSVQCHSLCLLCVFRECIIHTCSSQYMLCWLTVTLGVQKSTLLLCKYLVLILQ